MLCGVPFPLFFDTVLNSDLWVSAICDSTYFESVLCDKVPTMTSNTEPYGICSDNSHLDGYEGFTVFGSNRWVATVTDNAYVDYEFIKPIKIHKTMLQVTLGGYALVARCKNFKILASNDGVNYDTLFEGVSLNSADVQLYTIPTSNYYLHYRLFVVDSYTDDNNDNNDNVKTTIALTRLQFYGRYQK